MKFDRRMVFLIILAGCIAASVGCQTQNLTVQDQEFERLFDDIALNQGLELKVPIAIAGQIPDGQIFLEVYNNSTEDIQFSPDMGRKIYVYSSGGDWIEVRSRTRYSGSTWVLSSRKGKGPESFEGITTANFYPDLSALGDVKQLRFMIVGTVVHDGQPTDQQVGAYVDVNLDDYPPPPYPPTPGKDGAELLPSLLTWN